MNIPDPLKIILGEMCNRVGANFADIDFQEDKWYWKHSWAEQDDLAFQEWLVNHLKNNKEAREVLLGGDFRRDEEYMRKAVRWFMLQWGWKLSDE